MQDNPRIRLIVLTLLAPLAAIFLLLATMQAVRAQPAPATGGDGPGLPAGPALIAADNNKNKVTGLVVSGPSTGFEGEWQILEKGTIFTVTITAQTEITGFGAPQEPPRRNQWVEAKGRPTGQYTLTARKFRSNVFFADEIIARLAATAVITDVVEQYRVYRLTPIAALPTDPRTYRFGIDPNADEAEVTAALSRDTANFDWAELNYISAVPTNPVDPSDPPDVFGNPYRTWKWGSGDPQGYVNQNAYGMVNLPAVQDHYSGTGVIVAVLDTGIDATHPVFAGRVISGLDLVSQDFVPQDGPQPGDFGGPAVGHGTHVSGVIARLAPEAKLLPVRVLDVDGRGSTFDVAFAIDYAVSRGATVINLSLGADADTRVLAAAVAAARARGVVLVAAAGNDDVATPQYPAVYPGVLAVSAVDEEGQKAPFSNYGASWVDIAAPGVGITSTVPVSGEILYGTWSGTSMATPFAAGAAALLKSREFTATGDAIATHLIDTGQPLTATTPLYAGQLGPLLDLGAALGLPEPQREVKLYLPAVLQPE
jgi:subtilisin family serine protease